jgi:2,4-dienoyl-CoA reductase-like NADH-dependent reductase (Old Yellow Enzyme family)
MDQSFGEAGVDIFHCSQRRSWEPEFEGADLNLASWAKKLSDKFTITVGSVGLCDDFFGSFAGDSSEPSSLDELIRCLDSGDFGLVGVGSPILANPHWSIKIHEGRLSELKDF